MPVTHAEHGVSQPAASARMRLLEGQLSLVLIERSPRGSKLTPAGALVAGWAQAVVDAAESLDAGLTALRRERDSRLRIAASMAEYLLPASARNRARTRARRLLAHPEPVISPGAGRWCCCDGVAARSPGSTGTRSRDGSIWPSLTTAQLSRPTWNW